MKNSWYMIISLDANENITKDSETIVIERHIQVCHCGNKTIKEQSPAIQNGYASPKCQQCGNEEFIFCTMQRHFHESLYELFDPFTCNIVKWDYSEGIVGNTYHLYANLILPHIDFSANSVTFKREKILSLSIDKRGNIQKNIFNELPFGIRYFYIPTTKHDSIKKPLQKDDLFHILDKKLTHFILRKPFYRSKMPAIFATDEKSQIQTLNELQFFMRYPLIDTAEILRWEFFDEMADGLQQFESILGLLMFVINGRKEKSVRKALFETYTNSLQNGKNYNPRVDFIFSRTIDNTDLLVKAIEPNIAKMECFQGENVSDIIWFITFLKKFYSEKSIVSFFAYNDLIFDYYWKDIVTMISQGKETIKKYFQKVKCDVKSIHDEISRILKIEHAKKSIQVFSYPKDILEMQTDIKELVLRLPQDSYELFEWSEMLHNCLFSYGERIAKCESIVYGVFIDKQLKYALEVTKNMLLQASGCNNTAIPKHHMQIIDIWLETNHIDKMPEDFYLIGDLDCAL